MEKSTIGDKSTASVIRGAKESNVIGICGSYHMECIGPDGKVKWVEDFDNLITQQGGRFIMDQAIGQTTNFNKTFARLTLLTGSTASQSSTYASPSITEITDSYVVGSRAAPSWNAATDADPVVKSTTATSFSITGGATNVVVTGCALMLATSTTTEPTGFDTIGNVAASNAVLYSAGTFTGGNKTVSDGDTLNVTYTTSLNVN